MSIPPSASPSQERPALSVLIADPHAASSDLVHTVFTDRGWDVTRVFDGESALDMCLDMPFGAVLISADLDGVSAGEVARFLRLNDRELPLVVMATDAEAQSDDLRHAGISAFVTRPIEPSQLDILERRLRENKVAAPTPGQTDAHLRAPSGSDAFIDRSRILSA